MERGLRGAGSSVAGARLFDQVSTLVREGYVDSISQSQIYRKTVDGLLHELHDPHSVFLDSVRLRSLNESTTGRYAGIGIQMDLRDGWITVVAPLPGSPAERAGIRTGDRVVEIEGKSTSEWTADEASKALRGEPGTSVKLMVERPGVAERIPLRVERQQIHVSSARYAQLLGGNVGYVDFTIFSESSAEELRSAVDSLRKRGMTSLILDLRGNPGGLLDQGVEVSELFLDPGQRVVSTRGRSGEATREFTDESPQPWPDMPVVVLVDRGSASASEIVAGALQDQDRAAIVGVTSYGKGSAQSLFALPPTGALKLTTAKWFTPLGRSIDRPQTDADDGDDTPDETTPAPRQRVRTPGGRVVLGGGGITPDVIVQDTARPPAERALEQALGKDVTKFRDALAAYALELKGKGAVSSPDFVVTPAMRNELYARLTARGVTLDRAVYDRAESLVTRVLGAQIARYAFGPQAEFARGLRTDQSVAAALGLLNGVRTPKELLDRAATRQRQQQADSVAAAARTK
jgi:carboxyl-terminal processing protease